jgi:lipopolysaccharide export system protein LptA
MRLTLAALAVVAFAAPAAAQGQQGSVTSAFSGFSAKSNEPVNVESDNLEVRDQDQAAVFSGNVVLKQAGSTVTARKLTIFYYKKGEGPKPAGSGQGARPAQGETRAPEGGSAPEAGRDIRRMEAEGDVTVTQRNQKASGARGTFDVESNKVELSGGVVVSQNDNVIRGERLRVDLTTQTSRIEGGGGRVQGVFRPQQR